MNYCAATISCALAISVIADLYNICQFQCELMVSNVCKNQDVVYRFELLSIPPIIKLPHLLDTKSTSDLISPIDNVYDAQKAPFLLLDRSLFVKLKFA